MGQRRAQLTATALLSATTNRIVLGRLNCSHRRSLTSVARRRPLARDTTTLHGRRFFNAEVKDANIAVLGGGLTGLTTAYYLAKKLPSTAKITLFEGSERLGGWIRTDRVPVDVDGKKGVVSFERGTRSLTSLAQNTWRYDDLVFYDLCLDLGLQWQAPPDLDRYLYYPDHLVRLPPGISLPQAIQEPLYQHTIWGLVGALLRSYTRGPPPLPTDTRSIAQWLKDISGGTSLGEHMASAMIHGIYGGDIDKLSAATVLDKTFWQYYLPKARGGRQRMPASELGVLETLGKNRQIQKMALMPKGNLIHFGKAGMQSLTDALGQALREQENVEIKMESPISQLSYDPTSQKVKVSSSEKTPAEFDKVISTLTSETLSTMTPHLPSLSHRATVNVMTVNIWYPYTDLKPPGFGYLIPRSVAEENNPEKALGVFFDSDCGVRGPDEPEGTKLFVLMGGHYYEEGHAIPSEEEAIAQAKTLLERHLGISRETPCHAVAALRRDCIPQHYVGHQERMHEAHRDLTTHFGGRLAAVGGSFRRIGTIAALRAGYDIAAHTAKEGIVGTGIESIIEAEKFAELSPDEIPVRRFRKV